MKTRRGPSTHRPEQIPQERNHADHVKAEHALQRIMAIEEHPDYVMITTTDTHLARGIGEALHHAYQGSLDFNYLEAEPLLHDASVQPASGN